MRPFEYVRADDVAAAVALVSADAGADYLAGGTTQLDLMLKDGVIAPERLVDVTRLPLRGITAADDTLLVGALTTMEELAADSTVAQQVSFVREALLAGASPQLRNMATIGGNPRSTRRSTTCSADRPCRWRELRERRWGRARATPSQLEADSETYRLSPRARASGRGTSGIRR
jgi:CO/xanthine dehydrogenase FAD-binding subunit